MPTVRNDRAHDLVLGAGGVKGFGHLGLLRALQERHIIPKRVIGVSIGSTIATLYTNGFSVEQIRAVLLDELHNFDKGAIGRFMWRFNPCRLVRQGGIIDLRTLFANVVEKYGLEPQPNLAIVAYDLKRRKPVLFEGTNYDLVAAISGSCAVPLVMQAMTYSHGNASAMRLVDGGLFHPCPTDFSVGPAIVSRLGLATKAATEKLPLVDKLLHGGERLISRWWEGRFKGPRPQDILVRVGRPDVGTLTFSSSPKTFADLESYGYRIACLELDKALAAGRL